MTILPALATRCALLTMPVLLAACSSADAPTAALVSSSPSSGASVPTPDPEQQAVEQAVAFVPTYVQALNTLFADPSRPIDGIYDVAVDPEATTEAGAIQAFRSNGYTQSGSPQVVSTTTGDVDLAPTADAGSDLPSVRVTACIDVSQVQVVDASGAPAAAAAAPFLVVDLTIVNTAYPDVNSWRVSSAPNTQADACPG